MNIFVTSSTSDNRSSMQSEAIASSIVAIWPPVVPLVPAFPAGPADLDVITAARKQDCTSRADCYCFFYDNKHRCLFNGLFNVHRWYIIP